jgi:AAHS family 4-hydroxybenzoate transporter-like MFS transporter
MVICAYIVEFFLGAWMPTILLNAGADIRSASLIAAFAKVVGISGAMMVALLMDRFGMRGTLGKVFVVAAFVICLLSFSTGNPFMGVAMILVTYLFVDASFAGMQGHWHGTPCRRGPGYGGGWLFDRRRMDDRRH